MTPDEELAHRVAAELEKLRHVVYGPALPWDVPVYVDAVARERDALRAVALRLLTERRETAASLRALAVAHARNATVLEHPNDRALAGAAAAAYETAAALLTHDGGAT